MNRKSELRCTAIIREWMAENGIPTSPQKPAGQQPEPSEEYWACPRHPDMKDGAGPLHASLKINGLKNEFFCGPCGGGGGPWQLVAFLSGEPWQWASMSEADLKPIKAKVAGWLRGRGLLAELPEKNKRSRKWRDVAYPVLREFPFRPLESTKANAPSFPLVALLRRYDVPLEEKANRFRWFHPEVTSGGAGGAIELKPGNPNMADLPLYVGQASPKDEAGFLRYLHRFCESSDPVLTEGQHDADCGAEFGLATATAGGVSALQVLRRHLRYFQGKRVALIQHPGAQERVFCEKSAAMLSSVAVEVKILTPADMWPPGGVKDLADLFAAMTAEGMSRESVLEFFQTQRARTPEWRAATGEKCLDAAYEYLRRFGKISHTQAVALTLWIAHAFIYRGWRYIPYLHLYSPDKGEGKSTILDLLAALLGLIENVDDEPVLIRPTLSALFTDLQESGGRPQLIDEIDFMFSGRRENDAPLYAYLNAGNKRGATVLRTELEGGRKNKRFPTFCPKALSGRHVETLDDSTRDRCIPIKMEKADWGDRVKAWTPEFHLSEGQEIGARIRAWCESLQEKICKLDFLCTTSVSMRAIDIWRPLLCIAELAGNKWLEWAHSALVELVKGPEGEHDSPGIRVLRGILHVRDTQASSEGIHSNPLVIALQALGGEFLEWGRSGKGITANRIAKILKGYGIAPGELWLDGRNLSGYRWTQFEAAWKKRLPEYTRCRVSETLGKAGSRVSGGVPKSFENQDIGENPRVLEDVAGGLISVKSPDSIENKPISQENIENDIKWVRFSEFRTARRAEREHHTPQPRIYNLFGPNPDEICKGSTRGAGPGRLITENGHETAALDISSLETRPMGTDRMEHATANFTRIERRGK